ncbi:MAG: IclR family transcriptional regulator [Bacillota bacterium]|nr:IclR family transcriptional regulator [Bacillota bacterium]
MLNRAFSIIECLSEQNEGMGITEVSKQVGLHKSTVFRILNALRELGYVKKNEENEKYGLSMKFLQLSSMMLNDMDIKVKLYPYLKRLALFTHQTAHLCIMKNKNAVYLDKVEAYSGTRMFSSIGSSVPLHSTAIGKVLVAWLPREIMEPILVNMRFEPRCVNTILTRGEYIKELEITRNRGYGTDDLENEEGIRCAAAPIRDHLGNVIAAISVSGSYESTDCPEFCAAVKAVCQTAEQITKEFGYTYITNCLQNNVI